FERDILRNCRHSVILLNIHAHDARRLRGAISARKRRAKRNRNLAKNSAGDAPTEPAFNSVEGLDHLDLAAEDGKQGALSALGDRELTGPEVEVGRGPGQPVKFRCRQGRKQRNCCYVFDGQHGRHYPHWIPAGSWAKLAPTSALLPKTDIASS